MEPIIVESFSWIATGAEVYAVFFKPDQPPSIKKGVVKLIEEFRFDKADGPYEVIITVTCEGKDVSMNEGVVFKTEQDAQVLLDRCIEAGKEVDLVFCKLEGECIEEGEPIEKPDEVKAAYERAVNPSLMAEILDVDYDGIDFFGQEYYTSSPISRVGQTYNESGIVRFKNKEKLVKITGRGNEIIPVFAVEIITDRKKLQLSRKELLEIDDLCFRIKHILYKDGSKEE